MIQFRTGPHMGIPYQEARALGLSSALKGPEFYEQYVSKVQTSTPSERLLRGLKFYGVPRERLGKAYKGNRPTVTLSGLFPATQPPDHWGQGDYIVGLMKAARDAMDAQPVPVPNEWRLPIPFDVLKPARKEKPE